MPELKQRAVTLLAELKELEHLARWWAEERDPVVGRVLAQHHYVADFRQGMRVEIAIRNTVLTALNALQAQQIWELPEQLHILAVRPLLDACGDPELGPAACQAVHECPWFELLTADALRAGCAPEGRRQVVLDSRLPADPGRRAVLHLLREEFAEVELLDPDGSLMSLALTGSDDALRHEVLSRLRSQGRTLQALELLGVRSRRSFEEIVSALLVEGRLNDLWDLTFHLPPDQAAGLLEQLRQADFVPEEVELWNELLTLLPHQAPQPGVLAGQLGLLGELVLRAEDARLTALQPLDGLVRWSIDFGRRVIPYVPRARDGSVLAATTVRSWSDDPFEARRERNRYRFFDGPTGEERWDLQDLGGSVLAFSPDGTKLAQAGPLQLNLTDAGRRHVWHHQDRVLRQLVFASDCIVGMTDSELLCFRWSPSTFSPMLSARDLELPWAVSPSGRRAAVSSRKEVFLTGPEDRCIPGRYLEIGFDAQERLLLIGRHGVERAGESLRTFPQPPRAAALSPARDRLAWLQQDDLWVEHLTDRRRTVRLSAPGARRLEYGDHYLLAVAQDQTYIWPTAWDYGPDRLERLGPAYRLAYLQARHRHRHSVELGEHFAFDEGAIQL